MDGRHQAISRPGPRLIRLRASSRAQQGGRRPRLGGCGRRGPGSARRSYRATAPAIRTIGHGSGQSSQNPSSLPARRLAGFLPGRIRLALRNGLNMHKAVNFWQLIAAASPVPLPRRRRDRPTVTAPAQARCGAAARDCRSLAPGRNGRKDARRDFAAGGAELRR
jgi:hypothetical protein